MPELHEVQHLQWVTIQMKNIIKALHSQKSEDHSKALRINQGCV